MQRVLTFFLSLLLGTAVAAGIAFLVHLIFPRIAVPVFVVLTLYWVWTGWRYAATRERENSILSRWIEEKASARTAKTLLELGEVLERQKQPKTILLCAAGDGPEQTYRILLEHWGYKVREASGLVALMAALKQSTVDLLILDVCHSEIEMNIRDLTELPYPILVIGCDEKTHSILMPNGFKHFLPKPIEIDAFRNKLQEMLGDKRSQAAAQ